MYKAIPRYTFKIMLSRYAITEKAVGETPLEVLEKLRTKHGIQAEVPLAYAGRLDPMASGKLLILIGKECKVQEKYHNLDKEYQFEVLLGVQSDTADVLGIISGCSAKRISITDITHIPKRLRGEIELPYPHFSSKTVSGKPLHTWALEGRLEEIVIPTKKSTIYSLTLKNLRAIPKEEVYKTATAKIETIPKVTDLRKAIGNDFRRKDVRKSWKQWLDSDTELEFQIATFSCIASSGSYMRTLAEVIARELGTCGLAYSIHRTKIGRYTQLPFNVGYWQKTFN